LGNDSDFRAVDHENLTVQRQARQEGVGAGNLEAFHGQQSKDSYKLALELLVTELACP